MHQKVQKRAKQTRLTISTIDDASRKHSQPSTLHGSGQNTAFFAVLFIAAWILCTVAYCNVIASNCNNNIYFAILKKHLNISTEQKISKVGCQQSIHSSMLAKLATT